MKKFFFLIIIALTLFLFSCNFEEININLEYSNGQYELVTQDETIDLKQYITYSKIYLVKYQDKNLTEEEIENITKSQQSAIRTIYYVFNALLKLFTSYVQSICEEIYSNLYEEEFNIKKSVSARGNWVNFDNFINDVEAEKIGKVVLNIVAEVRKFKSDKNISIKEIIDTATIYCDVDLSNVIEDLKNVCNVNNINVIESSEFRVVL